MTSKHAKQIILLIMLILMTVSMVIVGSSCLGKTNKNFTIIYLTDGNGTIEGEASQSVEYGDSTTTVTAIPKEGYEFVSWSDGVKTPTRIDKDIKGKISVTATFKKIVLQANYLTDGNGTIEGEASQSIEYGESMTAVTAIPKEGYEFVSWSDGVETAERAETDVKHNITVTAKFEKIVFHVNYETNNPIYGTLIEENAKYDVIRIKYQVAYGEDTPIVRAHVRQNELGEDFVFLYWSDGVTAEERQYINITSDLTITAYFGYKVVYKVNNGVGGKIDGITEQKLLAGEVTSEVTAIPSQGYIFCGWSDLSWETSRSGDSASLDYLLNYSAVWEYVAYFEPTAKTFKYNYGIASSTYSSTYITLNRDDIQSAKFVVPEYDGYTFCGWYADSDYRIRITTENGRYMYGYAAFSLETDTLYAKWQKVGEEADSHKILLVFVDEVQTELYSTVIGKTISVHSKMPAIDYEMGKWIAETIYNLLNDWFAGKIIFEVDCYFTTKIVTDGFSSGLTSFGMMAYDLYADAIQEISSTLAYNYHNTIAITGIDDFAYYLRAGNGGARIKNAAVYREIFFTCATADLYHKFLSDCKDGEIALNDTPIGTCLHELAHTAEMYFNFDYDLHTAIGYAGEQYGYSDITNTIKPYLLSEFKMNGEMCGVPMEYWKHQIPIHTVCAITTNGGTALFSGDTISAPKYIYGSDRYRFITYRGEVALEAIPNDGYRFVKWSDGITTAIRHDVNIIAYFRVEAIFEKI